MNLQFISDSTGKTTGVFIPIEEWTELKRKFKCLEQEEAEVPQWQVDIVRERLEDYKNNPGQAKDFDTSIDEIENDL